MLKRVPVQQFGVQNVDTMLARLPWASHLIVQRQGQLVANANNLTGWFGKYDPAEKPEAEA